MKKKWFKLSNLLLILSSFLIVSCGGGAKVLKFQAQKPGKINVPSAIKKIYIDPAKIVATEDQLNLKASVIQSLQKRLNALGRFKVIIGAAKGFDINKETVAVIQGTIVSGGEIDTGRLTEKAECKGGLAGAVGAVTAGATSQQGITVSKRGILCKQPNIKAMIAEAAMGAVTGLLGVTAKPRVDEVIRVYNYKNFSLFAQVNLSLTEKGKDGFKMLANRTNTASFRQHKKEAKSYRNVRESGQGAGSIYGLFGGKILFPFTRITSRRLGVVSASNPGSWQGKWLKYYSAQPKDLDPKKRKQVLNKLVQGTLTEFIRTISPYKVTIEAETAKGGNAKAEKKLKEGKFVEARKILEEVAATKRKGADLYNLALSYEAGAVSGDDYFQAMQYYSQALDKQPKSKLYAQGVGRMEFQLSIQRKLKKQTK
jgi:hypothetical protein